MRRSHLFFPVLFVAVSLLPASAAWAAEKEAEREEHVVQNEGEDSSLEERNREREQHENSDKLRVVSISDSPDPYSPPVAGSLGITAEFEARPTDAGAGNAKNGKTFSIRVTVTVSRNGTTVRTLSQEFPFTYPADLPASRYHPVTCALAWDGRDANGAVVADGGYSYTVQGTLVRYDELGNGKTQEHVIATSAALAGTVVVDGTAPVISDLTPPDGTFTNDPQITISARVADATSGVASVTLTVEGDPVGAYDPTTGIVSWTPDADLPEKWIAVALAATDAAGNAASATWSFCEDRTPPVGTPVAPAPGSWTNDPQPTVVASFSDALSGLDPESGEMTVGGQDAAPAFDEATKRLSGAPPVDLPEGGVPVAASMTDLAGNIGDVSWSFNVDLTPPAASSPAPADGSWTNDATPDISASLTDPLSGVDPATITMKVNGVEVEGPGFADGRVTHTPGLPLPEGDVEVTVAASDAAGNAMPVPFEWTFRVDVTPPDIERLSPPDDFINQLRPEVAVTVTDALSGVDAGSLAMSLDGSPVATAYDGAGRLSFTPTANLDEAAHTVTVAAADAAGNPAAPFAFTFTVDVTPPPAPTLPPGQPMTVYVTPGQLTITIIVEVAETGTTLAATAEPPLDIQSIGQPTSPGSVTVGGVDQLAAGEAADVDIVAVDAAGNESEAVVVTIVSHLESPITVGPGPDYAFASVQAAVDALDAYLSGALFQETWEIVVAGGPYTTPVLIPDTIRPTEANRLILRSVGEEPVVLDGSWYYAWDWRGVWIKAGHVTLSNFDITGFACGVYVDHSPGGIVLEGVSTCDNVYYGLYAYESSGAILECSALNNGSTGLYVAKGDWRVEGCRIEDSPNGVLAQIFVDRIDFIGNILTGSAPGAGPVISASASPCVIEGNVVVNDAGRVSLTGNWGTGVFGNLMVVRNNVFVSPGTLKHSFTFGGNWTLELTNNTFCGGQGMNIDWVGWPGPPGVNVRNNIFSCLAGAIDVSFADYYFFMYTCSSDFNDWYSPAGFTFQVSNGNPRDWAAWKAMGKDANSISADPLFADAASGDFRLKSQAGRWDPAADGGVGDWVLDAVTSLCIDAGDPETPVGSEPSPNGGLVNLGAYGGTDEASRTLVPTSPLTVGLGGPDQGYDYASPQAAVSALALHTSRHAGGDWEIWIDAGTYAKSVVVPPMDVDSLILRGATLAGEEPASKPVLSGLPWREIGLDLRGGTGSVEVRGLEVNDYLHRGILVSGSYAGSVTVQSCALRRNGATHWRPGGMVVEAQVSGSVAGCVVEDGPGYNTGILMRTQPVNADPSGESWDIIGNVCSRNEIGIKTDAPGLIASNICEENRCFGIYTLCREPGFEVRSNECWSAGGMSPAGFFATLADGATLDLVGNVFVSTRDGGCASINQGHGYCYVAHNTFYAADGTLYGALGLSGHEAAGAGVELTHNIIAAGSGYALNVSGWQGTFVSSYNDIYAYDLDAPRIGWSGPDNLTDVYTDISTWAANHSPSDDTSFSADPFFADREAWDFHLKSQGGRWSPAANEWVFDAVTSPCIDAGDPTLPVGEEPHWNGRRINVGAYGGTGFASRTPIPPPTTVISTTPVVDEEADGDLVLSVIVAFSRAMDTASVEDAFLLSTGSAPVTGTIEWLAGDEVLISAPDAPVTPGAEYALTIVATPGAVVGAMDANGFLLDGDADGVAGGDYTFSFIPVPVPLTAAIAVTKSGMGTFALDASASNGGTGEVTEYVWLLDGRPMEGGVRAFLTLEDSELHVVSLTVRDSAGDEDSASATLQPEWPVDSKPGGIKGTIQAFHSESGEPLDKLPDGWYVTNNEFDIVVTVTEGTGPFEMSVSPPCGTVQGLAVVGADLPEGRYVLAVTIWNEAGDYGEGTVPLIVDKTPPVITVTKPFKQTSGPFHFLFVGSETQELVVPGTPTRDLPYIRNIVGVAMDWEGLVEDELSGLDLAEGFVVENRMLWTDDLIDAFFTDFVSVQTVRDFEPMLASHLPFISDYTPDAMAGIALSWEDEPARAAFAADATVGLYQGLMSAVTFVATDRAGNTGYRHVPVVMDTSAPTLLPSLSPGPLAWVRFSGLEQMAPVEVALGRDAGSLTPLGGSRYDNGKIIDSGRVVPPEVAGTEKLTTYRYRVRDYAGNVRQSSFTHDAVASAPQGSPDYWGGTDVTQELWYMREFGRKYYWSGPSWTDAVAGSSPQLIRLDSYDTDDDGEDDHFTRWSLMGTRITSPVEGGLFLHEPNSALAEETRSVDVDVSGLFPKLGDFFGESGATRGLAVTSPPLRYSYDSGDEDGAFPAPSAAGDGGVSFAAEQYLFTSYYAGLDPSYVALKSGHHPLAIGWTGAKYIGEDLQESVSGEAGTPRGVNLLVLQPDTVLAGKTTVVYMNGGFPADDPGDPDDVEISIDIIPNDANDPARPVPVVRLDPGHEPRVVERDPANASVWRSVEFELVTPDDALGLYDIEITCKKVTQAADPEAGIEEEYEGVDGYVMDQVLNILKIEYLVKTESGELVPTQIPPESDPRPVVEITGLTTSTSGGDITATVTGHVHDALADIMQNGDDEIAVTVYAGGVEVELQPDELTRAEEATSLTRPYAHRLEFSKEVTFAAATGGNLVAVVATNALGNFGEDFANIDVAVSGTRTLTLVANVIIDNLLAYEHADEITFYYGDRDEEVDDPEFPETAEDPGQNASTFAGAYSERETEVVIASLTGLDPGVKDTFDGTIRLKFGTYTDEMQATFEETDIDTHRFAATFSLAYGWMGSSLTVNGIEHQEGTGPGAFAPFVVQVAGEGIDAKTFTFDGRTYNVVERDGQKYLGSSPPTVFVTYRPGADTPAREEEHFVEENAFVVMDGTDIKKTVYKLKCTPRTFVVGQTGVWARIEIFRTGALRDYSFEEGDKFYIRGQDGGTDVPISFWQIDGGDLKAYIPNISEESEGFKKLVIDQTARGGQTYEFPFMFRVTKKIRVVLTFDDGPENDLDGATRRVLDKLASYEFGDQTGLKAVFFVVTDDDHGNGAAGRQLLARMNTDEHLIAAHTGFSGHRPWRDHPDLVDEEEVDFDGDGNADGENLLESNLLQCKSLIADPDLGNQQATFVRPPYYDYGQNAWTAAERERLTTAVLDTYYRAGLKPVGSHVVALDGGTAWISVFAQQWLSPFTLFRYASNRVVLRRTMTVALERGHVDLVATFHSTNLETAQDIDKWLEYGIEGAVAKVFGLDAEPDLAVDDVLEYAGDKTTMSDILSATPLPGQ